MVQGADIETLSLILDAVRKVNDANDAETIDPSGAKGEHFHSLVDKVLSTSIFVINNDNTRAYASTL
jgi:hypothetical protein